MKNTSRSAFRCKVAAWLSRMLAILEGKGNNIPRREPCFALQKPKTITQHDASGILEPFHEHANFRKLQPRPLLQTSLPPWLGDTSPPPSRLQWKGRGLKSARKMSLQPKTALDYPSILNMKARQKGETLLSRTPLCSSIVSHTGEPKCLISLET